ncbi:MAG: hypothetical protein WCR27_05380 [Eubacteriales bacterium]
MKIKMGLEEFEVVLINGGNQNFQGQNRDTLEFVFKKDEYNMEFLYDLFSNEMITQNIVIIDDEKTYYKTDYILKISMEVKGVKIEEETPESKEVLEERIFIKMGQLSYIEKQLSKLNIV